MCNGAARGGRDHSDLRGLATNALGALRIRRCQVGSALSSVLPVGDVLQLLYEQFFHPRRITGRRGAAIVHRWAVALARRMDLLERRGLDEFQPPPPRETREP